jgi:hypothetical protein
MAERHIHLAFANPAPGKEAEFEDWYENVHVPDLLKVEGYISGQRFRLSEKQKPTLNEPTLRIMPTHRHLTIYELDCSPETYIERTKEALKKGIISHSNVVAPDSVGWLYTVISNKQFPRR